MIVYSIMNTDYKQINRWLQRHGHEPISEQRIGLIVPGVAAAFLLRTDSDIAIVDGLVSNPLVSSETRHKALEAVLTELYRLSAELGFKRLIAWTRNDDTLSRVKLHGFVTHPHVLISREN